MDSSSRKRNRNAAEAEAEAEEIGLLPSQPNGTSQQVNAPTIPKTITDVSGSTSDPVKESGGSGAEAGEKGLLPSQLDGTFQPVKAPTATIRKRVRRFKRDEVSIIEEEDGGEEDDEEVQEDDAMGENFSALEEATLGSPVTDATVDVNRYVDTTKRTNDDDIEIHEGFSGDKVSIIGSDRSSSLEGSPASINLQKSLPIQPTSRRRSRASRLFKSYEFDSDHEQTALSSMEPNPGIKRPTVTVLQPPPPPPTL